MLSFLPNGGRRPLVSPIPKSGIQAKNIKEAPDDLEQKLLAGFKKYGKGTPPPIATQSANLAKAGRKIQQAGGDPLLPALISLKESGGGKFQAGTNNPYGTIGTQNGKRGFINYSSPEEALLGGTERHPAGFTGNILKNYGSYLKSGSLADFFSTYTPVSDPRNPSIVDQVALYNKLRAYFQ